MGDGIYLSSSSTFSVDNFWVLLNLFISFTFGEDWLGQMGSFVSPYRVGGGSGPYHSWDNENGVGRNGYLSGGVTQSNGGLNRWKGVYGGGFSNIPREPRAMRERYHRLSVQGSGGWRRYGYYSVDYQRRYILHGGWAKRGYTGTPRIGVGKRQRVSGLSSVKKDVISSKGLKVSLIGRG